MEQNIEKDRKISIDSLGHCQLLMGLTPVQLENLLKSGEVEVYSDGETIIHEGETGNALYIILDGKVVITSSSVELAVLSPGESLSSQYEGDFFGEMSLLDMEPRSANVSAHGRVRVLKITREKLEELFVQDRELQLILFINIARILSRRLRAANIRKVELHKKTN